VKQWVWNRWNYQKNHFGVVPLHYFSLGGAVVYFVICFKIWPVSDLMAPVWVPGMVPTGVQSRSAIMFYVTN
jgi:hypothetical protein